LSLINEEQYYLATLANRRNDDSTNFALKRIDELVRSPTFIALATELIRKNGSSGKAGIDGIKIVSNSKEQTLLIYKELNYKILDTYQAQPLRRVYIPKANHRKRPLGIPTIKDRIVQKLYQMFLDPIIEATSDPDSYGFRKGRSAHNALGAISRKVLTHDVTKRNF
jgi:retron-type reverse transcriptase